MRNLGFYKSPFIYIRVPATYSEFLSAASNESRRGPRLNLLLRSRVVSKRVSNDRLRARNSNHLSLIRARFPIYPFANPPVFYLWWKKKNTFRRDSASRTFDRIIAYKERITTIKIPLISIISKKIFPPCSKFFIEEKKETINFSVSLHRLATEEREDGRGVEGRGVDPAGGLIRPLPSIGGWRSFEELGSSAGPGKCGFVHGEPGLRRPWGPWRRGQIPWRGKREATPQPSHPVRPWGRRWRTCPRTGDWTRCNRK